MPAVATCLDFSDRPKRRSSSERRYSAPTTWVNPGGLRRHAAIGRDAAALRRGQWAIMDVGLLGGHLLMGTDVLPELGSSLTMGNNAGIMPMPDSKPDADALFTKLGDGGSNIETMQDVFRGDSCGHCTDRFGVCRMIDVEGAPAG